MSGVNGSALECVNSCNLHSPSMKPCVITSLLLARKLEHTEVKQLAQENTACVLELTQTPASVPFTSLSDENHTVKNRPGGTSLVVQWIRIRLPMQGTQVQSLAREDPMYHSN